MRPLIPKKLSSIRLKPGPKCPTAQSFHAKEISFCLLHEKSNKNININMVHKNEKMGRAFCQTP